MKYWQGNKIIEKMIQLIKPWTSITTEKHNDNSNNINESNKK